MKSLEKTRIKGITELSKYFNGLELQFHDLYSYMGILVDMSDTLRRFLACEVGLIVNVLDWDINDVFNDSTTSQEVNWHRHMTRLTRLLITTTRI